MLVTAAFVDKRQYKLYGDTALRKHFRFERVVCIKIDQNLENHGFGCPIFTEPGTDVIIILKGSSVSISFFKINIKGATQLREHNKIDLKITFKTVK